MRSRGQFLLGSTVAVALLVWGPEASAQGMRTVPIGGRTATMGGAGTAAGNDSAAPYVNPAGMAGIPGDIFAVSANIYGYSRRQVPKLSFPNGQLSELGYYKTTENNVESSGVVDTPSSIMYFQHVGEPGDDMHHVFGMSMVIPNATSVELVGTTTQTLPDFNGKATENVSVIHNETDYYFGPSYAISFEDRLRVGMSVYALHTRAVKSVQYATNFSLSGGSATNSSSTSASFENESWAVVPIVGFQASLTDELWLGGAVAAPSFHMYGTSIGSSDTHTLSTDTNNFGAVLASSSQNRGEGSHQNARPLRANVGGAWEDRGNFSAAVDGYVFFARDNALETKLAETWQEKDGNETSREYQVNKESTRDLVQAYGVSAGIEVGLTEVLALRAGGFSDASNEKPFRDEDGQVYEVQEDRAGGTVGLGIQFGSFDTTVGLVYTHGWGKIKVADMWSDRARVEESRGRPYYPMVDTTFDSVMFVFSGAVTTEEAQEQIRQVAPVPVEVNMPEAGGPPPARYGHPPPAPAPQPPPTVAPSPPPAVVPPPPPPAPAPVPEPIPAPEPGGQP